MRTARVAGRRHSLGAHEGIPHQNAAGRGSRSPVPRMAPTDARRP